MISFSFQRIALVLLTLHYCSELVSHTFQLIDVFDRDEKYIGLRFINSGIFFCVRFATMVIAVLTLYYGLGNTNEASRGLVALVGVTVLQGYLIFSFITEQLRIKRERQREAKLHLQQQSKKNKSSQSGVANKSEKSKRKKESDLPEVDQNHHQQGKIKVK